MPLLVAAEIDGRRKVHCEASDGAHLVAIGAAAVILAPRGLLREAEQIRAGYVVVVT